MDEDSVGSLRRAVRECSERGLHYASKWCVFVRYIRMRCDLTFYIPGLPNFFWLYQKTSVELRSPKIDQVLCLYKRPHKRALRRLSLRKTKKTYWLPDAPMQTRRNTCEHLTFFKTAEAPKEGSCIVTSISLCVKLVVFDIHAMTENPERQRRRNH